MKRTSNLTKCVLWTCVVLFLAGISSCGKDDIDISQNAIQYSNAGIFKFLVDGTNDTISNGGTIRAKSGDKIHMFFEPENGYEDYAFIVKYTLPNKEEKTGAGKNFAAEYVVKDISSGTYIISCSANYIESKEGKEGKNIKEEEVMLSASGTATLEIKE